MVEPIPSELDLVKYERFGVPGQTQTMSCRSGIVDGFEVLPERQPAAEENVAPLSLSCGLSNLFVSPPLAKLQADIL